MFTANPASRIGEGIVNGIIAGLGGIPSAFLGRHLFGDGTKQARRLEGDIARLETRLSAHSCNDIRCTINEDSVDFRYEFPEGSLVRRRRIETFNGATDWVAREDEMVYRLLQNRQRQNEPELNSFQEYYEALNRLGAVQIEVSHDLPTRYLPTGFRGQVPREPSATILTVTFLEGDIEQRIDLERIRIRDYLTGLWRDMRNAYQMLIGNYDRQHYGITSIETISPRNNYGGTYISDDGTLYVGGGGPGGEFTIIGDGVNFTSEEIDRAKELLLSCLTVEQAEQLETKNSFIVTSQSGEQYRITFGRAYNVIRQCDSVQLCAGPAESVPTYDLMLAQKLLIENNEQLFLEKANIRGGLFFSRESTFEWGILGRQ